MHPTSVQFHHGILHSSRNGNTGTSAGSLDCHWLDSSLDLPPLSKTVVMSFWAIWCLSDLAMVWLGWYSNDAGGGNQLRQISATASEGAWILLPSLLLYSLFEGELKEPNSDTEVYAGLKKDLTSASVSWRLQYLSSDEYWIYAPTTYNGVDVSMGMHFQGMDSQAWTHDLQQIDTDRFGLRKFPNFSSLYIMTWVSSIQLCRKGPPTKFRNRLV